MQTWETIRKTPAERAAANLDNYRWVRHDFTWAHARRDWLAGLPGGGLNIGYEALDRHLRSECRDKTALRCLDDRGGRTDLTYADLTRRTNRFTNLLAALGVRRGERVFLQLDQGLERHVAALGTLRHGAVLAPLSPALDPAQIAHRLVAGEATVLVTAPELYERQIAPIRDRLPALRHVLVTGDGPAPTGAGSLADWLDTASDRLTVAPTDPEEAALLHFTTGGAGPPKGVVQVHDAVVAHFATALFALDLHPDDVFWCTADPDSVAGSAYGITAPLAHGLTVVVGTGAVESWRSTVQENGITVWYAAPEALRRLMWHGGDPPRNGPSSLRFVASAGDALGPETVARASELIGRPVHENWCRPETGAIMISNFAGVDIRPGSIGLTVPGATAGLLECDKDGRTLVTAGRVRPLHRADVVGELALRAGWPSMFRSYPHDPQGYADRFVDGWYRSGELARRDGDGYFWLVGRQHE